MLREILDYTFYQNRVLDYAIALGAVVVGVVVLRIAKAVVLRKLRRWAARTETTLDDFVIRTVERAVVPLLYLGLLYMALRTLTFHAGVAQGINVAATILGTLFGIRVLAGVANYFLQSYWLGKEKDKTREKTIKVLIPIIRVIIWSLGLLFLLDNLGFNVSTAIAGLGIGGIAVALAAQAILGDLFSYFAILLDRPFELGDYIVVDDKEGTVEHIGIKTTRVRSLSGEELVFANTDLTGSRVRNFKRMHKRRVAFTLGVTYDTPAEKLREIPGLIEGIMKRLEGADFDRAHFAAYADSSLNFEVVYYVMSNDYKEYMDIQQQLNLRIYEEFAARKIEFAYPTQTIYLAGGSPEGTL